MQDAGWGNWIEWNTMQIFDYVVVQKKKIRISRVIPYDNKSPPRYSSIKKARDRVKSRAH